MVFSTLTALREEVRAKASAEDLRVTGLFLAELFEYLVFLFVMLVVALNMNGLYKAFPLVRNVRELVLGEPLYPYEPDGHSATRSFLLYENVRTRDEAWTFLSEHLGDALFSDEGASEREARFALDGALLKVGAVRIVTARVRATWDECASLPVYREQAEQPSITTCYPRPSDDADSWDGEPFGTPDGHFAVDPALIDERRITAQARRAARGRRLRAGGGGDGAGRRGVADGTGGEVHAPEDKLFKIDLPSDLRRAEWRSAIDDLRAHGFIDSQSRVLEVLVTLYSAEANLYCCVTIDVTLPFTGGAFGAATFFTVEPVRHLAFLSRRGRSLFGPARGLDAPKLAAELVFLGLLLRTLGWEARKAARALRRVRSDAARDEGAGSARAIARAALRALRGVQLWSVLQLVSLSLHLVVLLRRYSALSFVLHRLNLNPPAGEFVDMHAVADEMYTTQNWAALNALFSFLSLFKFATVVPMLSMLSRTIEVAFNDLLGFLFMFAIVFAGFMQAFQLSFGQDLRAFASSAHAFYTLFGLLSGDVNLNELRAANRLLGPLLFFGYAVFVVFVLLNMFVAIVTSAYSKAKRELKGDPTTGKLYKTIVYTCSLVISLASKQYKFLVLALRSKKTQREISTAIQDGVVTLADLREILRKSRLGERSDKFASWRYWSAADLVMRRYDPGGSGWLSKEQLVRLQADMAAESEARKLILERDYRAHDEATRIELECARRLRVHTALTKQVDGLVEKHGQLLRELDASRQAIHRELGVLTGKLWRIWERCELI